MDGTLADRDVVNWIDGKLVPWREITDKLQTSDQAMGRQEQHDWSILVG